MTEETTLKALQQRAVEMVLATSSMTGDLTDDEAKPLITWAVAQAEAVAREVATGDVRRMAGAGAQADPVERLGDRLTPVRKIVRAVSSLAVDRHRLEANEVAEEIDYVSDLAARLPGAATRLHVVSAGGVRDTRDLAVRQAEMDNESFVSALLDLLPSPEARPAQVEADASPCDPKATGSRT